MHLNSVVLIGSVSQTQGNTVNSLISVSDKYEASKVSSLTVL